MQLCFCSVCHKIQSIPCKNLSHFYGTGSSSGTSISLIIVSFPHKSQVCSPPHSGQILPCSTVSYSQPQSSQCVTAWIISIFNSLPDKISVRSAAQRQQYFSGTWKNKQWKIFFYQCVHTSGSFHCCGYCRNDDRSGL